MKGKSVGDNKIPVADRVFFTVHPPSGNSRPLFVSKSWTVSNNLYMFLKLHLKHLLLIYWKCLMSYVWIHVYGMTKIYLFTFFSFTASKEACFLDQIASLLISCLYWAPPLTIYAVAFLQMALPILFIGSSVMLHLLFYLYQCSSWLRTYSLKYPLRMFSLVGIYLFWSCLQTVHVSLVYFIEFYSCFTSKCSVCCSWVISLLCTRLLKWYEMSHPI